MKEKLEEQYVILLSLIKWLFLATIVGIITGISTTIFLKLLGISTKSIQSYQYYFLLLPLVFFVSSTIVKYLAPDAEGHGTEKIIEAFHKRNAKIKLQVVPVKLVATIITIAGGGSAGKEGPCTQIGAGLASGVADLFRLNDNDRKKIVICGISAGFTTVFGTPLTGTIFAIEILILGRLLTEYIYPALVSAIVGYKTATLLGIDYFKHTFTISNSLDIEFYLESAAMGIFLGLVAIILIELMKIMERFAHHLKWWTPLKGLLGGAILAILAYFLGTRYLGIGVETAEGTIIGEHVPYFAFLLKIIFTAITLNMGGSGGIISPICFIGATAGFTFASLFGLDPQVFSAIGWVAFFAGAANAPITAIVMSVELFGLDIAPYAAIACVIAYLVSGHRSAFPTQLLAITKSDSIQVEKNIELKENNTSIVHKWLTKKEKSKNEVA